MHAVPLGSVLDVAFWISRMLTWLQVAFRCWGKRTSTVNITNDTAAMSHLQTREVNCNVFCRTICSWLKWTRKWKLYPEKSVIQIKASNSKLSTMRAQFSVWVSVCVLHSYSYSVIFTPVKESKTCMTNFFTVQLVLSLVDSTYAASQWNLKHAGDLTSAGNALFVLLRLTPCR